MSRMKRAPKARPKQTVRRKTGKRIKSKPEGSSPGQIEEIRKLTHLSQVNLVELEHQNQELRLTEEELEASRNKYINLFDFSPIPYFTLDPDGVIKEINLSAGTMLGSYRSKLVGRNLQTHIPLEDRNSFSVFLKTVFNSGVRQSSKLRLIGKDKRLFHVLLEGLRSDDTRESEKQCQIALIDLTEYKKLEEAFHKVSEELKLLKAAKGRSSR